MAQLKAVVPDERRASGEQEGAAAPFATIARQVGTAGVASVAADVGTAAMGTGDPVGPAQGR